MQRVRDDPHQEDRSTRHLVHLAKGGVSIKIYSDTKER